jgi:hypothetical protein
MDSKTGMETYISAVGQENVQEREMEQNASFHHDSGDGGDGGYGGEHLHEAWVLD